jgi:hypothetical protein
MSSRKQQRSLVSHLCHGVGNLVSPTTFTTTLTILDGAPVFRQGATLPSRLALAAECPCARAVPISRQAQDSRRLLLR